MADARVASSRVAVPGRTDQLVNRPRGILSRAVVAGAATGLRSTAAMAALIDGRARGLPAPLMRQQARTAARVAVAVELVIDKLPRTPSRLGTGGLVARVVFAGAAAVVLARGNNRPVLSNVFASGTTALVAARVGHDLRVMAGTHFPPLAVAVAEDAVALGLAAATRG